MKFLIVFLTMGFLSGWLTRAEEKASRLHLYYGSAQEEIQKLEASIEPGSIVVIDYRAFIEDDLVTWIESLQTKGARVLAYLSVGELHSSEKKAFKKTLSNKSAQEFDSILLNQNNEFSSYRVDVVYPEWFQWVEVEVQKIYSLSFDGVFLDTVDTVDHYVTNKQWSFERRIKSVQAMIDLIGGIKKIDPKKYILQNGGLNMIGEKMFVGNEEGILAGAQHLAKHAPSNPDGIVWENAFAGKDEWTMAKLNNLIKIKADSQTDVFAIGYRSAHPEIKGFAEKCEEQNFIGAWAISTRLLHEVGTIVATTDK